MVINEYSTPKQDEVVMPITSDTFARWGIDPLPWFACKHYVGSNSIIYWYKNMSDADKAELLKLDDERFRYYEGPPLSFERSSIVVRLS